MFTGIITEVGIVRSARGERAGRRLRVEAPATARGLLRGGSVAVDGVCLTAISIDRRGFEAQVVPETCRRSTLGAVRKGAGVNLERPIGAGAELSGHFVQGHVDAFAQVEEMSRSGGEAILAVQLSPELSGLVVEKGSIAINGVSLTVASVTGRPRPRFAVALIPHTLACTNLGRLKRGDRVNLEADVLGKYVQAFLQARKG